jgi:hypothetical protein
VTVHRPFRITPRALDATTGVVIVVAALVAAWPARAPEVRTGEAPRALAAARAVVAATPSAATPSATTPSVAGGPLAPDAFDAVVAGNVFSASRRAPTARFTPPGSEPPDAMPRPDAAPAVGTLDAAGDGDGPRLHGIVTVDGGRRALLLLRADEPARLLAVGDRHAGYRVLAIEADRVVLDTGAGRMVLRLAPPASRDSTAFPS